MDESKSFLVGGFPSFITYVVFHGRIPGIYTNFEDCKSQVFGFPNSRFQPFDNPNDACSAWRKFCSHTSKNDISTEAEGYYAFHCASQSSPVEGKKLLPMMNEFGGCHTPSECSLENLSAGGGRSTTKPEVVNLSTEVREISVALNKVSLLVNESIGQNKVMNTWINNLVLTMEYLQVSVSTIVKTIVSGDVSSLNDTDAPWPVPAGPLDGKDTITTPDINMNVDACELKIDTQENLKFVEQNIFGKGKTGSNADFCPEQVVGWPCSITSKKLFLSPTPGTPDLRHSKAAKPGNPDATLPSQVISASNVTHHSSPIGTVTYSENSHLEYTPNYTGGYVLPDGILSTFPPTRDMMLNRAELQVAAYVFHPEMAHCEVIMRMGKEKVTREDFNCFWEGNVISSLMMRLMAIRATHMQRDSDCPRLWLLPPSFADSVLNEQTVQELFKYYGPAWMPPLDCLSHIYLPILDDGFWFLAIISLKDGSVFHVDSNLSDEKRKRRIISTVCAAISDIISIGNYPSNIKRVALQFSSWGIKMATGTPDCNTRETSADWVLYWLRLNMSEFRGRMNHDFTGHYVCDHKYHKMRMLSALALLMDSTNEKGLELALTAELKWTYIKNGD